MPLTSCISAHVSIRHSGGPGPPDSCDEEPRPVARHYRPGLLFFVLFECHEGNAVTGWAIPRTIDKDVGHPTFPVSAITANFYG
jgi:hypothetical protein